MSVALRLRPKRIRLTLAVWVSVTHFEGGGPAGRKGGDRPAGYYALRLSALLRPRLSATAANPSIVGFRLAPSRPGRGSALSVVSGKPVIAPNGTWPALRSAMDCWEGFR